MFQDKTWIKMPKWLFWNYVFLKYKFSGNTSIYIFITVIYVYKINNYMTNNWHNNWWPIIDALKVSQFRKQIVNPWIFPKNERMNSFLLLCDVFSFVFWKKLKTPKKPFEITWPLENLGFRDWKLTQFLVKSIG